MKPGLNLDILQGPEFNALVLEGRKEIRAQIEGNEVGLLSLTPPCGSFSRLQNLQKHRTSALKESKKREGLALLQFACEQANRYIQRGGIIVLEQPATASSWDTDCLKGLRSRKGVITVDMTNVQQGSQMGVGMPSRSGQGSSPIHHTLHRNLGDFNVRATMCTVRLKDGTNTKASVSVSLPGAGQRVCVKQYSVDTGNTNEKLRGPL